MDGFSLGAGDMGAGPFLDEKGVRQDGLHADLSIAVNGKPSKHEEVDVREGQTVEFAGYRVLLEKVLLAGKGTIVFKVWSPPKPAKPARRWPFSWFGR